MTSRKEDLKDQTVQLVKILGIDKTNGLQFFNHIFERVSSLVTTYTVGKHLLSVVVGQYKPVLKEDEYYNLLSEQPCAEDQLHCAVTLNSCYWSHIRVIQV